MRELLPELLREARDPVHAHNLVREYLQARVLAGMQRAGAMIPLAFQGGTALRFLYGLPRFSEDLDFALERPEGAFSLRDLAQRLAGELRREGYELALKISDRKVVGSVWLRFSGLLFELGLATRREQVLGIKIEVDTRPPAGARCSTSVVRRHFTLNVQHHDRASLLAGKLHAILQRPWTKGRDWYDLLWYLADPRWPPANMTLLNNALEQSGWSGPALSEGSWRSAVLRRLDALDIALLRADVAPFVEPGAGGFDVSLNMLRRVLR